MKTRLLLMLFVFAAFAGCKKETDYRDSFIGKYDCDAITYSFDFIQGASTDNWKDTLIITKSGDSSIFIKPYCEETPIEVQLFEDGHFRDGYNNNNGHFSNDSLFYNQLLYHAPSGSAYIEFMVKNSNSLKM